MTIDVTKRIIPSFPYCIRFADMLKCEQKRQRFFLMKPPLSVSRIEREHDETA